MISSQPATIFLYPYIASWFARCPELKKYDLSFIKHIAFGGSVLDPTSAQLMEKNFPGAYLNMVNRF